MYQQIKAAEAAVRTAELDLHRFDITEDCETFDECFAKRQPLLQAVHAAEQALKALHTPQAAGARIAGNYDLVSEY